MIKFFVLTIFISFPVFAQNSMRRCALLPITDNVGGAVAFKVFEEVEHSLKKSNWCSYFSNSGLLNVFSKYRENLAAHLKQKAVIATVADRLKVGSLIRIGIVNEVNGVELEMDVYGENGEDLYLTEKASLNRDDIDTIVLTIKNWLDLYAKTIPYDAKINGVLGEQITLDVGKGHPIEAGQKFLVKRLVNKKKHPLLQKIVDWDSELLAEGAVFSVSDEQALGMVKVYKSDKKLQNGDWVRLLPREQGELTEKVINDKEKNETLGTLGILSLALLGSSSSVDTNAASGSNRLSGSLFGFDARVEGWITRQWFAAFEIARSLGGMKKSAGAPEKNTVNVSNGTFKLTGGYKYLPVGFFYGPQIDVYGGYANYSYDLDYSAPDGFGQHNFTGFLGGIAANVPINREFRFFTRADLIPFPTFDDKDSNYGTSKNVSAMEFEIGLKYHHTLRMTIDASLMAAARKAKFDNTPKEVSYKDNVLKIGMSFNF
jgi:hypothetical protein